MNDDSKYRTCGVCKKETDQDNTVCGHCNSAVFVVDFGQDAKWFRSKFVRFEAYEACFELPIVPPPAHGTKVEIVCKKYVPVVFNG